MKRIFAIMRFWTAQILMLALVAFSVLGLLWWLDHTTQTQTDDAKDEFISGYNKAIARLGITPIYPPTENIQVGDVFAGLVGDDLKQTDKATLSQAVRIHRISFSPSHFVRTHSISETKIDKEKRSVDQEQKNVISFLKSDHGDYDKDSEIPLHTVLFPRLVISAQAHANLSRGQRFFSLFGDSRVYHELDVNPALIYGVRASDALVKFYEFCNDKETKYLCQDDVVRKIVGATVDNDSLAREKIKSPCGKRPYKYDIRLSIITGVYLSRHMVFRQQASRGGQGELQGGPSGSAVSGKTSATYDAGLNVINPRPVVFGVRTINWDLLQEKHKNEQSRDKNEQSREQGAEGCS